MFQSRLWSLNTLQHGQNECKKADDNTYGWLLSSLALLPFLLASQAPLSANRLLTVCLLLSAQQFDCCHFLFCHYYSKQASFTWKGPISVAWSVSVKLRDREKCPHFEFVNRDKRSDAHFVIWAEPFSLPPAIQTLRRNSESWEEKLGKNMTGTSKLWML